MKEIKIKNKKKETIIEKKNYFKQLILFLNINKLKILLHFLAVIVILLSYWFFYNTKINSLAQKCNVDEVKNKSSDQLNNKIIKMVKEENYPFKNYDDKIKNIDFEKLIFEKNIPILMYHYIELENTSQSTLRRSLSVTPENFENQMKYLYDGGYKTLTLSEYFSLIAENQEIPQKAVLITIDDGYRDFFENAAPILNRYNMTATVFIITDSVGYPAYMDWNQIKLLSDQGFEFGSHTLSHANLTSLEDDKIKKELEESKKRIEEKIDKNVNFLCYPMGFFDARVETAARKAGYRGAFTTINGYKISNKNIFEIPRFRIAHTISMDGFAWTINSAK